MVPAKGLEVPNGAAEKHLHILSQVFCGHELVFFLSEGDRVDVLERHDFVCDGTFFDE